VEAFPITSNALKIGSVTIELKVSEKTEEAAEGLITVTRKNTYNLVNDY
jgi:hypothetical protein